MLLGSLIVLFLAQQGDVKGEKQPPLPEEILKRTPPSPVVPPQKALETMHVAPGFRVELVAAEPLVHDPIAMAFDEDGRLFVIEMRAFMPDVDGKGEDAPIGRVVMLEDTDGDGKMDRATVVVDGLVQPRALAVARGGLLVAEPPNLWFIKDGRKTLVDGAYCPARSNPEHAANGLLPAIDNWFYNANSSWRYRFVGGQWTRSHTRFRGQWGITQDDLGRLFFNYNTIFLRGDLVPCYTSQAHSRLSASVNLDLSKEQTTWPARPTPGVNRGYRPGVLRPDGTIVETNSACSPVVHRGDALPDDCRGNIFVCDPSGNLVKRLILDVRPDRIVPHDAYDRSEFLASTDERFRPVFLGGGPDGALYVVDMYRGIIQHGAYMTSFLRSWIQSRGLDRPIGLGRIYRVVDAARAPASAPRFSAASSAELVAALSHPNGWRRDTAQRLLVERAAADAVPALRGLARREGDPIPRLHALWTLEGLGAVDSDTLSAMDGVDCLRAATESLRGTAGPLISPVDGLVAAAERDPLVPEAMLEDRELDFLEAIMSSERWDDERPGRSALLARAARRIAGSGRPERVTWLVELTACQAEAARWRQRALLEGLVGLPEQRFDARPTSLLKLIHSEDRDISTLAAKVRERVRWPGDERPEPVPPPTRPLTPDERSRFDRGRRQFVASCAGCHRRSGLGEEGGPPPLVDSSFVQGSDERLVRIVLHGLEGPLRADGKVYRNLNMPAILNLSSDEIADVLTYVRREWGHRADPVPVEKVRAIKKATEDREEPWTQVELLKLR